MSSISENLADYFKTFEFERYKEGDTKSGRVGKIATNAALGVARVAVAILTLTGSEWMIATHAQSINRIINMFRDNSFNQKISHVFQELISKKTRISPSPEEEKLAQAYWSQFQQNRGSGEEGIFFELFCSLNEEQGLLITQKETDRQLNSIEEQQEQLISSVQKLIDSDAVKKFMSLEDKRFNHRMLEQIKTDYPKITRAEESEINKHVAILRGIHRNLVELEKAVKDDPVGIIALYHRVQMGIDFIIKKQKELEVSESLILKNYINEPGYPSLIEGLVNASKGGKVREVQQSLKSVLDEVTDMYQQLNSHITRSITAIERSSLNQEVKDQLIKVINKEKGVLEEKFNVLLKLKNKSHHPHSLQDYIQKCLEFLREVQDQLK